MPMTSPRMRQVAMDVRGLFTIWINSRIEVFTGTIKRRLSSDQKTIVKITQ